LSQVRKQCSQELEELLHAEDQRERSFTRRMTSIRRSLLSIWLQHKGAATSSRKSFMKRSSKSKPPETDEETWDRVETRQLLGSKASMPADGAKVSKSEPNVYSTTPQAWMTIESSQQINPGCPGSPSAGRPSGSIDEILSRPERDSSVDRCTMLLPTEENINEEGFPSKPPSHNDKDKEIPEKETLSHITHAARGQEKDRTMDSHPPEDEIQRFSLLSDDEHEKDIQKDSRIDSDGNEVEEEWDDTPEQEEEYSTSASIQVVPLKVKGPLPGSKISQIKTSIEKQLEMQRLKRHKQEEEERKRKWNQPDNDQDELEQLFSID